MLNTMMLITKASMDRKSFKTNHDRELHYGEGQQSCKIYQNYKWYLKHDYQTFVLYVSGDSHNISFLLIILEI